MEDSIVPAKIQDDGFDARWNDRTTIDGAAEGAAYPSQVRPVSLQRLQKGRSSSHFTFLILFMRVKSQRSAIPFRRKMSQRT